MKTGPSKLFRKLSINRRSNRIGETARANAEKDCDIKPVENYWKARTILRPDADGFIRINCGAFMSGPNKNGITYEVAPS